MLHYRHVFGKNTYGSSQRPGYTVQVLSAAGPAYMPPEGRKFSLAGRVKQLGALVNTGAISSSAGTPVSLPSQTITVMHLVQ